MDRFLIYGLVDPITGQLRYIGRSSSWMARPRAHSNPSKCSNSTHNSRWVRGLLEKNLRPNIVVIQAFDDSSILNQAEIHWIAYFRAMGCPLTNLTDGGFGTNGYKQSSEHISKRSWGHIGKRRSDESRARMSAAAKKRPVHPNAYIALSKRFKGTKQDPEFAKRRTAHLKKPVVDQFGHRYESIKAAERFLDLSSGSISRVISGIRSHAKGYTFRFLEESDERS